MTTPDVGTTPDTVAQDSVGRDVLETRALLLERSVLKLPGVTPELLQAQRPGGVANRDASAMGWLTYLNWLHGMRGVALPGQSARGHAAATSPTRWSPQVVDDLRRAFAAEPIFLTLESGLQVGVYPKGLVAASRIVRNQLVLEWLETQRAALFAIEPTTPEILEAIDYANACEARLRSEWLWCIATPGPRLPWDVSASALLGMREGDTAPLAPPEYHDALTQRDVIAVHRAFIEVNYLRLATLSERMQSNADRRETESAPLAHFLGVIAGEHGVQAEIMAHDWSIGAAFASALSRAESTAEATRRAKEKSDRSPHT